LNANLISVSLINHTGSPLLPRMPPDSPENKSITYYCNLYQNFNPKNMILGLNLRLPEDTKLLF
jgi:hypothetical protein